MGWDGLASWRLFIYSFSDCIILHSRMMADGNRVLGRSIGTLVHRGTFKDRRGNHIKIFLVETAKAHRLAPRREVAGYKTPSRGVCSVGAAP